MPALVNGANEAAVAAFLDGRIRFLDIGRIVSSVLEEFVPEKVERLGDVLDADKRAREFALAKIDDIQKNRKAAQ